ncbi:hypothetical protein LTR05_008340 [Lithohypha guttulata]|uniref:RNase III domain-containing protein n=1 Tax=Lithohypha guttulata TaxID=1690604 RepID=A0AAN7SUI8_9EURO|nr:hypothetical protein LTR05_008340 [Lithohypha guttulata]
MPSLYAKKVAKCEAMLNITFSNKLLCLEALQMSGNMLPWNEQFLKVNKNDRLAVLGDTVLKSYLCKKWYHSGRVKGQWADAEQTLVRNTNLARIGLNKSLKECIIDNPGTVRISDKMLATTVEALIGAAYCDAGDDGLAKAIAAFGLDEHEFLIAVTYHLSPLP